MAASLKSRAAAASLGTATVGPCAPWRGAGGGGGGESERQKEKERQKDSERGREIER